MTRLTGSLLAAMCTACRHEQIAHGNSDHRGPCLAHGCDCQGFAERRRSKYGADQVCECGDKRSEHEPTLSGPPSFCLVSQCRCGAFKKRYDSGAEFRRAGELALEERSGAIRDLRRQVPFPITVNGVEIAVYLLDFMYVRAATGETVYEDVKGGAHHGTRTAVYALKKRAVEAQYGIRITEVDAG